MLFKHWQVGAADKNAAKLLAEECDMDPLAAMIACVRGFSEPYELEQFITDEILLSDPFEFCDIQTAAEVIHAALENNETIAVYGDYDCDGVTATALMTDYLSSIGANVIPYIPSRFDEGYGMCEIGIDRLKERGVTLIITVDNGISCYQEVEYAKSLGIKVVVTDHHLPPEQLPNAEAVVDPHRKDCPSSFKEICGVAVAFQLVCVLADASPEQLLPRYADLLAIGTIGDVMPLVHDNRCFVKYGLELIKRTPRTGVSALVNVAGIDRATLNAGKVSFGIVPRLNAAGRMGSAERAFSLLMETDIRKALTLANELDSENAARRQIESDIFKEAAQIIEEQGLNHHRVIVVAGKNWHHGIVGIVASRIVEAYGRPAIVISCEEDDAKGSGRSFSGFSLYDAICSCSSVLTAFGGHELAAGVSLKPDQIDAFRQKINDYAKQFDFAFQTLRIDLKLTTAALTLDTAAAVSVLEPFGMGNPTPVFGIFECTLEQITPLGGGKHLKLTFSKNATRFQALLFSISPQKFAFSVGDCLNLAVTLSVNEYQGMEQLSIQIKELRPFDFEEEQVFSQYADYHDTLCGGHRSEYELPVREEAVDIYRYLAKGAVSKDNVLWKFLRTYGYYKTEACMEAFLQLGLIQVADGLISLNPSAQKCDLMSAPVFQVLRKGRE